jgi:uncharacterized membrane protein YphA (DoxX/SURF4 family)
MLRKTIVCLVLLRLAIGWHFFFEGWHKIHSHWNLVWDSWLDVRVDTIGQTETNRPFSSEGYFREATGPLGPVFRHLIGDLDEDALAHLTVAEGKEPTADRVPPAEGKDLDDYTKRFLDTYEVDNSEKERAEAKTKQTKEQVVRWLTFQMPEKEAEREKQKDKMWRMVKKASPDGKTNEVPMTAAERVVEYRAKLAEVNDLRNRRLPVMGQDVEKQRLIKAKADLAQMRRELLDDLDKVVTTNLKEGLSDILKEKMARVGLPEAPANTEEVEFLLPDCDGKLLPRPYNGIFDDYYHAFEATYRLTPDQKQAAKAKLEAAKGQTAKWLASNETKELPAKYAQRAFLTAVAQVTTPLPCAPLFAVTAAAPYDRKLWNDATNQIEQMKTSVATVLTPNQARGAAKAVGPRITFLGIMDLLTMFGLTLMGACLMVGLFTRTNCVLAAGFLALTYFVYPPFPWVPVPPNTEGYYFFVNKNLVEMLALLTLATTESGKWLGLDAMLAWFLGRKKPKAQPRPVARAA